MNKAMIFKILKWIAFALSAITWIAGVTAGDVTSEATIVISAVFFIILAIFFHLEQHKS